MTVAAELAAALHHSRDGGRETQNAPRGQTTASSWTRPGVPTEPEAQGASVLPTLRGVDGTTVSFNLAQNLKLMKEEEKERRRKLKAEKHVTRMRELDRRRKARPDGDAWREWKLVTLGLPSLEERSKKKREKEEEAQDS